MGNICSTTPSKKDIEMNNETSKAKYRQPVSYEENSSSQLVKKPDETARPSPIKDAVEVEEINVEMTQVEGP